MSKGEPVIFPPFQLDVTNQCLWRGDKPVSLRPKPFDLLIYLSQRPNQLVTKEELLEACWPGTAVTDTSLKVCIREIREALSDDPKAPKFIETAHRRGYRFIGRIEPSPSERDNKSSRSNEAPHRTSGYHYIGLFGLQLGWLHEQCFDFETALQMCTQAYKQAVQIKHPYTELLGLILMGLANLGLENRAEAFRCLSAAVDRFERERILMDWVLQIPLHHAFSRYWLAEGNPGEARHHADRVCELASQPGEKTYLALGHLMHAEIATREQDSAAAQAAVARALGVIEENHAPLAEWRVHVAAASLCQSANRTEEAELHRRRAFDSFNRVISSLDNDRLRQSLVNSVVVRGIRRGA